MARTVSPPRAVSSAPCGRLHGPNFLNRYTFDNSRCQPSSHHSTERWVVRKVRMGRRMEISSTQAFNNATAGANARWSKGLERHYAAPLAIAHEPKFKLDPAHRFFCIGSCFARNIEEALICRDVNVLSKRMVSPKEEHPARVTGVINKFTTASMLNEVRWALGRDSSGVASIVDAGQGWVDLQVSPSVRPMSRERVEERRRYLEQDYFPRIRDADVLVLTLGLIETWRDRRCCRQHALKICAAARRRAIRTGSR